MIQYDKIKYYKVQYDIDFNCINVTLRQIEIIIFPSKNFDVIIEDN